MFAGFSVLLEGGVGVDADCGDDCGADCGDGSAQEKEGVMSIDDSRATETIPPIEMKMLLFMEKYPSFRFDSDKADTHLSFIS
ncbi:MAG: hypothetical protein ACYC9S_01865 [Leptospirales bacterium]